MNKGQSLTRKAKRDPLRQEYEGLARMFEVAIFEPNDPATYEEIFDEFNAYWLQRCEQVNKQREKAGKPLLNPNLFLSEYGSEKKLEELLKVKEKSSDKKSTISNFYKRTAEKLRLKVKNV